MRIELLSGATTKKLITPKRIHLDRAHVHEAVPRPVHLDLALDRLRLFAHARAPLRLIILLRRHRGRLFPDLENAKKTGASHYNVEERAAGLRRGACLGKS